MRLMGTPLTLPCIDGKRAGRKRDMPPGERNNKVAEVVQRQAQIQMLYQHDSTLCLSAVKMDM
jgi:hypothetical protein